MWCWVPARKAQCRLVMWCDLQYWRPDVSDPQAFWIIRAVLSPSAWPKWTLDGTLDLWHSLPIYPQTPHYLSWSILCAVRLTACLLCIVLFICVWELFMREWIHQPQVSFFKQTSLIAKLFKILGWGWMGCLQLVRVLVRSIQFMGQTLSLLQVGEVISQSAQECILGLGSCVQVHRWQASPAEILPSPQLLKVQEPVACTVANMP